MNPEVGSTLWTLLHAYAHTYPDEPSAQDVARARAWLDTFHRLVEARSTGCRCAFHWSRLREQHPPDLSSRASFYWWTAFVHDEVNARLGKPRAFPGLAL